MNVLSKDQLEDYTGYKRPSFQIKWLRKNGVIHSIRADGHPRVTVSAWEARFGGRPQPRGEQIEQRIILGGRFATTA